MTTLTRAHSFLRIAEFQAEPWNLLFVGEFPCFYRIMRNFINERWLLQVFDPYQLPVVSKTLADFQSISNILIAACEWQTCFDLATRSGMTSSQDRLPKLAGLHRPAVASVDIERAFPFSSISQPLWPVYATFQSVNQQFKRTIFCF